MLGSTRIFCRPPSLFVALPSRRCLHNIRRQASTSNTFNFPIVSFEAFRRGSSAEQHGIAKQIYDSFHNIGWLYLKDHGIPQEKVDEMLRMNKRYFSQPKENKLRHKLTSVSTNQGFTPDGAESAGGVDHKESYEHRRFTNELCPTDEELGGFRTFMDDFYQECYNLSIDVLRALSMTMGLDKEFFTSALSNADPQLRLLHYMPVTPSTIEQKGHARIIGHTDHGFFTLLFQDDVGGLEVDPFHTGEYRPASPIPGTIIINVADLLQRFSNDHLRSTMHRVTAPVHGGTDANGMLPERYSAAFFVHPNQEMVVRPLVQEGESIRYDAVVAGEWRKENMQRIYNERLKA